MRSLDDEEYIKGLVSLSDKLMLEGKTLEAHIVNLCAIQAETNLRLAEIAQNLGSIKFQVTGRE